MSGGFRNKPKILRGAFVEYGLSLPPLIVVFQFNPVQLTRSRSVYYSTPGWRQQAEYRRDREDAERNPEAAQRGETYQAQNISLRKFHQEHDDLLFIRDNQQATLQEESINFEIRLDATDDLNDGNPIVERFGVAPRLATLELMTHPKGENFLGEAIGSLLGSSGGFSFTKGPNPPMILFIWGRKRILPVNINSMNITETEFSTDLNPIRATVSVNLTVIEGKNIPYTYSKAMKETMSALNLANITEITNVVIPG
ncbi:MAG: hypothetical protein PVG39_04000 [Desulfobacteraceae bacterium]|jgi:hypothetical protein